MNVSIEIDDFKTNKEQIKKNLVSMFTEILEYFEWFYQEITILNGEENRYSNQFYYYYPIKNK